MRSFVFCYLPTTVVQSLFDFIKHAIAHFASFLAPFLLVSAILCFQDTKICCYFFHIRKAYGEVWKRNIKTLLEIFTQGCQLCMLQILIRQDPNII